MTKSTNIFKAAVSCVGALVVVGGIIAASVAVSRANAAVLTDETAGTAEATAEAEPLFWDVDIPVGRYYRDGDVNSEYWVDVTEDKVIEMVGPDIVGEVFNYFKEDMPNETDEQLMNVARNSAEPFLKPNEYRSVQTFGDDTVHVLINWSVDDGCIGGFGYVYPEENTIEMTFMGKFILVK